MEIINKLRDIEQLYFIKGKDINGEDLDPQILQNYMRISGVDKEELKDFEELFELQLPSSIKELYTYKNGSGVLEIFCIHEQQGYRLLPLAGIVELKMHIQKETIPLKEKAKDKEVQAFASHKKWFPFATYNNASFLMLDFVPTQQGYSGQILEYHFETKEIRFVNKDIINILERSYTNIGNILK